MVLLLKSGGSIRAISIVISFPAGRGIRTFTLEMLAERIAKSDDICTTAEPRRGFALTRSYANYNYNNDWWPGKKPEEW